jgi:hypothetical protein
MRDNVIVGFPLVADQRSGAFATEDYYIRPVDKGPSLNSGNVLVNSHPGYKSTATFPHYSLAGALWDAHGLWGPAGNYFVYDAPFFTYGQPVTPVPPAGQSGGVSVPGPFYGILEFVVNNSRPYYHPLMALLVTRLDPDTLQPVGTWSVEAALEGWILSPMRHFAAHAAGLYLLEFPGSPMPVDLELRFENLREPSDTLVLGVAFSGAVTPQVYVQSYSRFQAYTAVGSLQELRASAGETWWQDTANDRVWVKLRGGFWEFWDPTGTQASPTDDELLYETTILHVDTD